MAAKMPQNLLKNEVKEIPKWLRNRYCTSCIATHQVIFMGRIMDIDGYLEDVKLSQ